MGGITIYRRIMKHTLRERLQEQSICQPIIIANQMLEIPTQLVSIVVEPATPRAK